MTTSNSNYVLVVDDDPDIRSTVEIALELHGYDVVSVADGCEALNWLRGGNAPPFLILLDFMMPGMSGLQFRAEQKQDPALAQIPTVVLTGAGVLSDANVNLFAAEVLQKPIGLQTLLSTVERHSTTVH